MKRIIAAALSVLVGAFGYTIVDSAIENRVATLESEVIELREEVSRYHPYYTTSPYEGSEIFTTEEQYYTTSTTAEDYNGLQVGDYLTASSGSQHKFLLRKWSYGKVEYISPSNYGNSVSPFVEITDPGDDRFTFAPTTAAPTTPTYKDYYLYITDTSAQITDISVKPSYYYNNNYSMTSVGKQTVTVKYTFKGYTDPVFAGNELSFSVDSAYPLSNYASKINNTINSDGTFEFCVIDNLYDVNLNSLKNDSSYSIYYVTVE